MGLGEVRASLREEREVVDRCIIFEYSNPVCPSAAAHPLPSLETMRQKISQAFGEKELDAIEFLGPDHGGLVLVTMKRSEMREYLLKNVSGISWTPTDVNKVKKQYRCPCRCILYVRPLVPLPARIHLTVQGIPTLLLKTKRRTLSRRLRKLVPGLQNVELDFQKWPGTHICNGTLLISGETQDVARSIAELRQMPKFLRLGGFCSVVEYKEAFPLVWQSGQRAEDLKLESLAFHGW